MMCLDVELRISEALKDPHPSQVVVDEKKKIKQKPTLLICGELLWQNWEELQIGKDDFWTFYFFKSKGFDFEPYFLWI